jgi:HK97 gp10 family phage protein
MAGKMQVRVDGIDELLKRFNEVDKSVRKKYLGAAMNRACKPAVKSLKANTPKGPSGNLRKSAGVKVERTRNGNAFAIIGYRRSGNSKGFHAWWLEDGVGERRPIGRAMRVPLQKTRLWARVKSFASDFAAAGIDPAFFVKKVRGYAATKNFERWVKSSLPGIARDLKAELGPALKKAFAEQSRRDTKRAAG